MKVERGPVQTDDEMPRIAEFWNDIADRFDSIYTGKKSFIGRLLDHYFRRDIYQRFEWVMRRSGNVTGRRICDIGCGSGRFVTEFARRGASHVTGVDVAPDMLKLARNLVEEDGVAHKCDFVLADVLNWETSDKFDITLAIGFWDYIASPPERLRVIRSMTKGTFFSAWPRLWTWRAPVRKLRLQYLLGCPVYFFRKKQIRKYLEEAGFEVVACEKVGKLFCVEARPV